MYFCRIIHTFSCTVKYLHTIAAAKYVIAYFPLNAIEVQAQSGAELLLYSVNAITAGTQSQGEVTVRLTRAGRVVNGVGTDPDIVAASAKAYLAALNRLHDPAGEKINAQMAP